MDPNACLERFLAACDDGNRDEASEAIQDLKHWIVDHGGFLPKASKVTDLDGMTSDGEYGNWHIGA